jgi:3-hydroxybutyryl-CoA dehydrogenase
LDRISEFARRLGKEVIVAQDAPGFIVNRLLVPYLMDAVRVVEYGLGTIPDIDLGMKLGCGHPMGPLTLLDLIGLDTACRVAEVLHRGLHEERFAPPPLLRRLVAEGHLGRKTGRGFYDYATEPPVAMEVA